MRLIDANVLIEAMKKTEIEYENAMTCPSWWSAFNVISEQPTAYSVAKVVEELEKELEVGNIAIDYGEFRLFEIVKQGGVSDDEYCKWKINSVFPETINNPHIAERENIATTKYCPCCGKKIKVVE